MGSLQRVLCETKVRRYSIGVYQNNYSSASLIPDTDNILEDYTSIWNWTQYWYEFMVSVIGMTENKIQDSPLKNYLYISRFFVKKYFLANFQKPYFFSIRLDVGSLNMRLRTNHKNKA